MRNSEFGRIEVRRFDTIDYRLTTSDCAASGGTREAL